MYTMLQIKVVIRQTRRCASVSVTNDLIARQLIDKHAQKEEKKKIGDIQEAGGGGGEKGRRKRRKRRRKRKRKRKRRKKTKRKEENKKKEEEEEEKWRTPLQRMQSYQKLEVKSKTFKHPSQGNSA